MRLCGSGQPSMTPTTRLVVGSMMCCVVPALLLCRIRTATPAYESSRSTFCAETGAPSTEIPRSAKEKEVSRLPLIEVLQRVESDTWLEQIAPSLPAQ